MHTFGTASLNPMEREFFHSSTLGSEYVPTPKVNMIEGRGVGYQTCYTRSTE